MGKQFESKRHRLHLLRRRGWRNTDLLQTGKRLGVSLRFAQPYNRIDRIQSEQLLPRPHNDIERHPLVRSRLACRLAERQIGNVQHHVARLRPPPNAPRTGFHVARPHMAEYPMRARHIHDVQTLVRRRLHHVQGQVTALLEGSGKVHSRALRRIYAKFNVRYMRRMLTSDSSQESFSIKAIG